MKSFSHFENFARLAALRPRLFALQLGGATGTLASLGERGPAVESAVAQELQLDSPTASAANASGFLLTVLSKARHSIVATPSHSRMRASDKTLALSGLNRAANLVTQDFSRSGHR